MAGIDAVQTYCGWHVAPPVAESLKVEGDGGRAILLPSLYVTDVTAVRDESGRDVTGWKWRQNGIVRGAWATDELYEFDVVHGHEAMPPELQEIIDTIDADGLDAVALRSKSVGPFAESYDLSNAPISIRVILDRYKLPPRP